MDIKEFILGNNIEFDEEAFNSALLKEIEENPRTDERGKSH